jgi:endonuclease YncB( thermonuclease family)
MSLYTYSAKVQRLVDADTAIVDVDQGFGVWQHGLRIRFAHINAPELATAAGKLALAYLSGLLSTLPAPVTLQTIKDKQDHYGRYLGVFLTSAGLNLNEALVSAGHAVPYEGQGKV